MEEVAVDLPDFGGPKGDFVAGPAVRARGCSFEVLSLTPDSVWVPEVGESGGLPGAGVGVLLPLLELLEKPTVDVGHLQATRSGCLQSGHNGIIHDDGILQSSDLLDIVCAHLQCHSSVVR